MKDQQIKTVKQSKQFQDSTGKDSGVDVGGQTVTWELPDKEWLRDELKVPANLVDIFNFIYEGAALQVRHHLASDWFKADAKVLLDKDATPEAKAESAKRMKHGYVFDYSKAPTLSSQQGNERTGQRWGKHSKYVPIAKTMVDPKLEVDSDDWKKAVIAKCEEIKKAMEAIKG